MGWPRLESELDTRPPNGDGSSPVHNRASSSSISTFTSTSHSSSSGTPSDGGNGICSCSLLSRGPKPKEGIRQIHVLVLVRSFFWNHLYSGT